MPLQAPGTEGSVGLQHAPPARDETRASDKTRPAPGRDQKRDDRAVPSISSLPLSCRGRGERVSPLRTPHSPGEIGRLSMIGRGACRGVSIPRPPKRLCSSRSSLCTHWPTDGKLARISPIGREPPQGPSLNSAHHGRYGVGLRKRGEGVLLLLL